MSGKIIEINEEKIKDHLGTFVKNTVEETLNAMLDAEADTICNAQRYERSPERLDSRAGHYARKLHTVAGEVELKVPKLRKLPFETAIVERYKRREISVEEALVEMYLAGVSVRRVEDITEALWGTKVSPGTISNLNKKVYTKIEKWRNRPIDQEYPYVYLDGTVLKKSWGGEVRNISVLVAVGVNSEGFREILGVAEGAKEDKVGWSSFLAYLKNRGLKGVRLFVTDRNIGMVESIAEYYPESKWQRCTVHYYRNVFSLVPKGKVKEVAAMLKAIHAQEDIDAARGKALAVVEKLKTMKLGKASEHVSENIEETLRYMEFPREHWQRIRTNNPIERVLKEVKRRTKVVGAFPDGESALMLTAARLRHVASSKWSTKKYLNIDLLYEMEKEVLTGNA
jgi:transposase-like protein